MPNDDNEKQPSASATNTSAQVKVSKCFCSAL